MTDLVETNFKEGPQECGCGCGVVAVLRARAWRDGVRCVKRGCSCRRCLGKRSGRKGDGKALAARKALGIGGVNSRHEEHWGGAVRLEAKAGAQIQPMWTAFLKAWAQSEAARSIGDHRPFVMTAAPDNTREQLVAFRLSDLADVVVALAEQMGAA